MEEEEAKRIAWKILAEVEETMGWEGVTVHASDPADRVRVRAFFEDPEYHAVKNRGVGILLTPTKVQAVLVAKSLDRRDR